MIEDDKDVELTKISLDTDSQRLTQSPAVLEVEMETKKALMLAGIGLFLENDESAALDPTDRATIGRAIEFVENPSENLADIQKHTTEIGEVSAGFMMQGEDTPAAIDALEAYLFSLQCVNRINFVEGEITRGAHDSQEVAEAIKLAADWALTLSKGYKDPLMLAAVEALKMRLDGMKG